MGKHLGAIVVSTVVALLVWLFAEAESLRSREVRLEVSFATEPGGDRIVKVADDQAWTGRVDVVLRGSTAALERAEKLTSGSIRLAPGTPGVPIEPGDHTVDLRSAFRGLPGFADIGVTIARIEPAGVRVRVDQLVPVEARVVVDVGSMELESAPEAMPQNVTVRVPSLNLEALRGWGGGRELAVTAAIPTEQLQRLVPGRKETVSRVSLRVPQEIAALVERVEPARADVSLAVRSRTTSIELPSVPVHVKMAGRELGRWDVTIAPEDLFIRNVKVTGPAEQISQVRAGDLKVTATVVLSFEELERAITSKEVVFAELPSPLKIEAESRTIRLNIKRR